MIVSPPGSKDWYEVCCAQHAGELIGKHKHCSVREADDQGNCVWCGDPIALPIEDLDITLRGEG